MLESFRAETWLYSTLTADTSAGGVNHATTGANGRIYSYLAPASATTYPQVIYNMMSGTDVMGVGAARVMSSLMYQVKVIGKGTAPNFGFIKAIADRIDTLLHAAAGTTADGRVLSCVREQSISYVEVSGSDVFSHTGGLFRIMVQPR